MELCFYFGNSSDIESLGQAKYDFFAIIVTLIADIRVYADKLLIYILHHKKH